MSNPFSQRFSGGSSREKPPCYGDEQFYDPGDPECRKCPVKGTCRVLVERRKKNDSSSTIATTRTSTKSIPKKSPTAIVEHEEQDTFMGVLGHNSCLNAGQAAVDTLSDAIASIPRKTYPNPIGMSRRKKT